MVVLRSLLIACFLIIPLSALQAQDSLNTSVAGHFDQFPSYSDVWGYETQSGTRYAILGTQNGTSIVDVTNPASPSEVLFIAGPASSWRDMKTHAGYAYLVTEGGGGMQVVNLETTPPESVTTYTATFDAAHNIVISDGYAYAVGASQAGPSNGTRVLDLADPENPVEVGSFNGFYIHDAVVRNDTMYAAAINSDMIGVVDFTNKAAPNVIASWTWEGSNAHNCDLTSDSNYLLTTDEVTGGDLHIFDIRDLDNVIEVATFTANPVAIIHNVLVEGDFAFISYYTEGVRILDIANPELPVEVGFYDTFPGTSGGFNGCWGVYPHASNGQIYASDIQTGLYILDFDLPWGAVQGKVTEQSSGTPLDAIVTITGGNSTPTNTNGDYKLYGDPGLVTVVTTSYGFEPDSSLVPLTQGLVTPLDIALSRVPSNDLLGTVISAADSLPIESVSLRLDGTPLTQMTDGSGNYFFPYVPHGVYSLELTRFGYAPIQGSVTVSTLGPLQENRFDFVMQPSAQVEDFEAGQAGWLSGVVGDNATTGIWVWADPIGSGGGAVQPEDDHSEPGSLCWVTGNAANASQSIGTNDVDGGRTTLVTPIFDATAVPHATVSYWRWFSNDAGAVAAPDTMRVDISSDGLNWISVEKLVTSSQWTKVTFKVADYVTPTILTRLRFSAEDIGVGSIVESAIDDFMVFEGSVVTDAQVTPVATRLLANYPNPFNPSTTLRFELAMPSTVQLRIYDIRGRLVKTYPQRQVGAGLHQESWNGVDDRGRQVATGVYLYEMVTPERRESRRMHLLK